ncbi:MAG: sulfite exporter TauE/SafE family protein [Pirellulales bacterium]
MVRTDEGNLIHANEARKKVRTTVLGHQGLVAQKPKLFAERLAMMWLWLLLFGVFVGVVSGLLGIGGGVLLIPGLMLLFGFSQQEAQGTSLAVLIPPIGLFAALVYFQHGYIRLPVVGILAGGFALGALIGAKLVPHLPTAVLRFGFGSLMLYLGFLFILPARTGKPTAALPAGLAAVAAAIVAKIIGRKVKTASPRLPPDDQTQYHI